MTLCLAALTVFAGACASSNAQMARPAAAVTTDYPRHAVGFRVMPGADRATAPTMWVWYPALPSPRMPRLTTRDYLRAAGSDETLEARTRTFLVGVARSYADAAGTRKPGVEPTLPAAIASAALDKPTSATSGAQPAGSRHPLVILPLLGSSGPANVNEIAEELASWGLVVALAAPVQAPARRPTWAEMFDGFITSAESVITASRQFADVAPDAVGIIDPYGLVAVRQQARTPTFHAIVALDEAPTPAEYAAPLTGSASAVTVPILHIPMNDPAPNGDAFRLLGQARMTELRLAGARHGVMNQNIAAFQRTLRGTAPAFDQAKAAIVSFLRAELLFRQPRPGTPD